MLILVLFSCKKSFLNVKKKHLSEGYIHNDHLLKNQVDHINIFTVYVLGRIRENFFHLSSLIWDLAQHAEVQCGFSLLCRLPEAWD